jgi:hypothetical protein
MKTASEMAEEIIDRPYESMEGFDYRSLRVLIAQALTAYAEERVKENHCCHCPSYEEARAEALEEAAKIVDLEDGQCQLGGMTIERVRKQLAETIRALPKKGE